MNKRLVGLIASLAILAPVGAYAMPAAGLAPAPQAAIEGAKLEKAAVVIRTGPRFRRGPVVVGRPFRRGFVGRPGFRRGPGIGVGIGRRGGVGIRIR